MDSGNGWLEQKVHDIERLGPYLKSWIHGVGRVLEGIRDFLAPLDGRILLALAIPVILLLKRRVQLIQNHAAISAQTRAAYVTKVGKDRGEAQALDSESARAIIKQCGYLVLVCGALVAFLL